MGSDPTTDLEATLVALGQCPDALPSCARWLNGEWGRKQGHSFEETLDWLRKIAADGSGELGFAAFCGNRPTGIALLVAYDLASRPDLTPWLSAFFVVPAFRGRSIGRQLIAAITEAARQQGHPVLYLYTNTAEAYYRELGWRLDERFEKGAQSHALMSLPL